MNLPLHAYRNFSPADKIKFIVVIHLLGILLIAFGFLLGLSFRRGGFQLPRPAMRAQPTPASSAPLSIPLAGNCTSPALVLGTTTFQIQSLTPSADGSLAIPANTSGIAYWIQGGIINPVFVLSPTPQNITAMATIEIGSIATLTGPDCRVSTFIISAPRQGTLDGSAFDARSAQRITVFFPTVSSGEGFLYQGQFADH